MADDNLDYLPQRAVTTDDVPSDREGRMAAFRARAGRFALPAVLVLSVSAGLAFGGLAPKGPEGQSLTAAPAPAAMPERDANQVTRSLDRAINESVAPKLQAAATPSEAPQQEAAAEFAVPAAQPKALTAFSASPAPTKSPSAAAASGRMFATETVNVRAEASASSARIGSVERGDAVGVTGRTSNGFSQVTVNDRNGWVSSEFLSRTAPAAPATSAPAAPSTSSRSGGATSAPAPARASGNFAPLPGLQPNAQRAYQALRANFPGVTSYGGVRPDWDAEHPSGRAIDAMTSNQAVGDAVANWARANAGTYGITEVIWNQRIWTTQRAGEGWRSMSDRGSATANHRDHVHISFR